MEIEYKGLAYTKFFEVLDKKDGLSFCEKLYSLTRPETLKAPLPYASDKQFYEACERYLGFPWVKVVYDGKPFGWLQGYHEDVRIEEINLNRMRIWKK